MISVITPVYNSKSFLSQSIESILNQSYSDFELILVDDGSTDGSSELCDSYAWKDDRIIVIHQANQGQAAARNRALDICKGEYIAFADSDDYIHPCMLEILFNNLIKKCADVSVCNYIVGNSTSHSWERKPLTLKEYSGKEFIKLSFLNRTGKSWILCDKLFKRSCFDNIRLPEGRINEDNATVYKIIYNAKKVVDCDAVLYYYFTNQDSTVNQSFKLKHLDYLLVLEEMIEFFTEHNEPELLDWANKSYLFSLAEMYTKVKKYCSSPQTEAELKRKLSKHYKQEKSKYPIDMETYPSVIEILKPTYAKLYWNSRAVKSKLTGK